MGYLHYTIQKLLDKKKHIERFLGGLGIDADTDAEKNLSSLINEKQLPAEAIAKTIDLLQTQPEHDINWILSPVSALTNHIQNYYHQRHRLQLPELIHMAEQLEMQHVDLVEYPKELHKLLCEIYDELLPHMSDEESIIFPMLAENKGQYIYCQVGKIMHHHDHLLHQTETLKRLTNSFTAPEWADVEWQEFYKKMSEFRNELLEHIRLENEILFSS